MPLCSPRGRVKRRSGAGIGVLGLSPVPKRAPCAAACESLTNLSPNLHRLPSEQERKITTTSFLDSSFMKTLASAIRFGTPLLVQVLVSPHWERTWSLLPCIQWACWLGVSSIQRLLMVGAVAWSPTVATSFSCKLCRDCDTCHHINDVGVLVGALATC